MAKLKIRPTHTQAGSIFVKIDGLICHVPTGREKIRKAHAITQQTLQIMTNTHGHFEVMRDPGHVIACEIVTSLNLMLKETDPVRHYRFNAEAITFAIALQQIEGRRFIEITHDSHEMTTAIRLLDEITDPNMIAELHTMRHLIPSFGPAIPYPAPAGL